MRTWTSILVEGVAERMELADRLDIGHQQLAEVIEGAEFPLQCALKDKASTPKRPTAGNEPAGA